MAAFDIHRISWLTHLDIHIIYMRATGPGFALWAPTGAIAACAAMRIHSTQNLVWGQTSSCAHGLDLGSQLQPRPQPREPWPWQPVFIV